MSSKTLKQLNKQIATIDSKLLKKTKKQSSFANCLDLLHDYQDNIGEALSVLLKCRNYTFKYFQILINGITYEIKYEFNIIADLPEFLDVYSSRNNNLVAKYFLDVESMNFIMESSCISTEDEGELFEVLQNKTYFFEDDFAICYELLVKHEKDINQLIQWYRGVEEFVKVSIDDCILETVNIGLIVKHLSDELEQLIAKKQKYILKQKGKIVLRNSKPNNTEPSGLDFFINVVSYILAGFYIVLDFIKSFFKK